MTDCPQDGSFAQFRRFLYLGDESKLFPASVTYPFNLEKVGFLELEAPKVCDALQEIVCAYKNDHYLSFETVVYALVKLCHHANDKFKKREAYDEAIKICSSAAMMLTFAHFHREISKPTKGWGRAHRRFLTQWYNEKEATNLASEVTRVKSRHKWSHKDVLCMSHVKAKDAGNAAVLKYLVKGLGVAEKDFGSEPQAEAVLKYLKGVYELHHTTDPQTAARLIEIHDLCLEHVPSKLLKTNEVSQCLISRLSLQNLLEQLPGFNKAGLLNPNGPQYKAVLERLTSEAALADISIGPLDTFLAIRKWQISNRILPGKPVLRQSTPAFDDALQNLHMASFKSVKPVEKRYLIALDTNLKMNHSKCAGCSAVTPSHISDLITMALVKADASNVTVVVFSSEELVPVDLNPMMNLGDVVERLSEIPPGPVVLSAPLNWALTKKNRFDAFLVFTDLLSSTQDNDLQNVFKEYKETMHLPDARYILSTLCDRQSSFPHADPSFLNIIGFNSKLLKIIQDFSCGVF